MAATVRGRYKTTTPRPPEHRIHLLASPQPSLASIVARRAPQLRRRSCPSLHGRGQILRQRGTVRRLTLPVASLGHGEANAVLAAVIRARNRGNHPRPDARAVGDRGNPTQDLAAVRNLAAVTPWCMVSLPSPSSFPSFPSAGRTPSPELRRRRKRRPSCFARKKTVRLNYESLTRGSHWSGF